MRKNDAFSFNASGAAAVRVALKTCSCLPAVKVVKSCS